MQKIVGWAVRLRAVAAVPAAASSSIWQLLGARSPSGNSLALKKFSALTTGVEVPAISSGLQPRSSRDDRRVSTCSQVRVHSALSSCGVYDRCRVFAWYAWRRGLGQGQTSTYSSDSVQLACWSSRCRCCANQLGTQRSRCPGVSFGRNPL